MFRKLALIAVGVLSLGCGEESKPDKSNVGAACGSETDCLGAADTCLITQTLSGFGLTAGGVIRYHDGHCTGACKTHAECGSGGKCPIGVAIREANIPDQYRSVADDILGSASNCYMPCTDVSECRANYQCDTVPAALTGDSATSIATNVVLSAILEGSISTDKYCLPLPASTADAGANGSM